MSTVSSVVPTTYYSRNYQCILNDLCFVHLIFLLFGFWYFGHFSCVIVFHIAHLASQNVNKDYIIFPYFRNSIEKWDERNTTSSSDNSRTKVDLDMKTN